MMVFSSPHLMAQKLSEFSELCLLTSTYKSLHIKKLSEVSILFRRHMLVNKWWSECRVFLVGDELISQKS